MRRHKRIIIAIIILMAVCAVLALPLLLARPVVLEGVQTGESGITVYSTFGPLYSLSELILRDVPNITHRQLVQPQDSCIRDHQLSDWELYLLAIDADLIIYGGSGLEAFEDVLQQYGDEGTAQIEAFYQLDMYNGGASANEEDETHFNGLNPHIYMSAEGVQNALTVIAGSMAELDPGYAHLYESNLQQALNRLTPVQQLLNDASVAASGTNVAVMCEGLIYPALECGLNIACIYKRENGDTLYDKELEQCIQQFKEEGVEAVLIEKHADSYITEALEAAGFAVAKLDIMNTINEKSSPEAVFEALEGNAAAIAEIGER